MSPAVIRPFYSDDVIRDAVQKFEERLLNDPLFSLYVKDSDRSALQREQGLFLRFVFGGSSSSDSKDLYEVHKQLIREAKLQQNHLDVIKEHVVAVLEELKVDKTAIHDCLAALAPARELFLPSDTSVTGNCSHASDHGAAQDTAGSPVPSIFERLGGVAAVRGIVDVFYSKLLQDARVAHFFWSLDKGALKRKQVMFMLYAFGGTEVYTGGDLYERHKPLMQEKGLNQSHFDVFVEIFITSLNEQHVNQEVVEQCMAVLRPAREIFKLREEDRISPGGH